MSKAALGATRSTVWYWFFIQCVVVLVVALLFFFWLGRGFAVSFLIGGMLCIAPNLLFAWWWFASFKATATGRMLKVFYMGEILKLLLISLLFIVALYLFKFNLLSCLIGFYLRASCFLGGATH